jgi:hypothetical protein
MKIAILGTSITSVIDAPYSDLSWKIWNISENFKYQQRFDQWFEFHDLPTLQAAPTSTDYFKFLASIGPRLMVAHPSPAWPDAERFPIERILDRYGDYFTCTFAYMMALAIDLHLSMVAEGKTGVDTIGLWGVDMGAQGEYSHQKPCAEYYIGWARALGIQVQIAPQSPICRSNFLYAYDNLKMSREMTEYLTEMERTIHTKRELVKKESKELGELMAVDIAMRRFCHNWQL